MLQVTTIFFFFFEIVIINKQTYSTVLVDILTGLGIQWRTHLWAV